MNLGEKVSSLMGDRAVSTSGHEVVPQPESQGGYCIDHVEICIRKVFTCSEIPVQDYRRETLIDCLCERVLELSTELDHIITIPHGINHVMRVASLMVNEIPERFTSLKISLSTKYGKYSEILVLLTALCHDLGYARIAESPIVFPAQIFGSSHCKVGADFFLKGIVPYVRFAFPDIPEKYLEDVAEAIRHHEERFSEEKPLFAEDNPLLFLLLIADKSDRVGERRLHALHQNSDFVEALFYLEVNVTRIPDDQFKEQAEMVRELEKKKIPEAISKLQSDIPNEAIYIFGILENQLCLLPWEREVGMIENIICETELSQLLLERFWILHSMDIMRWELGDLSSILEIIASSATLTPAQKRLAIGYFLNPFSPFSMYGTLHENIAKFLGVKAINYDVTQSGPEVKIVVNNNQGSSAARRIKEGLAGLYIDGQPLSVLTELF